MNANCPPPLETRHILIGCGEWGFRELPMKRHFEIAVGFGFHHLEFGIGGDFPGRLRSGMKDDEVERFRGLGTAFGIVASQCCLENDFTLPDAEAHGRMVKRTLEEIRLAHRLGATQVRLFAGFTPAAEMTEAIWQRMIAAFEDCQKACDPLGLSIAIETHGKITECGGAAHHEHTVSTDPESLRRLLKELPPRVGFNFDPGNLKAVSPDDSSFCLSLLDARISYCHLKDWKRKNGGWEAVAIGDDGLDYSTLLPRMSYDGVYLVEYEPTGDVEAGLARSLAYLRRIGIALRFQ